jgi:hypothetical protein
VVPLTRIGIDAITTRLINRLRVERTLGRYSSVSETPGFPRAIAGVIAVLDRGPKGKRPSCGSVRPGLHSSQRGDVLIALWTASRRHRVIRIRRNSILNQSRK